jgi:hypothetical protein
MKDIPSHIKEITEMREVGEQEFVGEEEITAGEMGGNNKGVNEEEATKE